MKKILAFAGSNNPQSINHQLASYASCLLDENPSTLINLRDFDMPVFGAELLENEGAPSTAVKLRELFTDHEGFIISVAEHNHSVSAVFKNAMDWVSKAGKGYNIFNGKPILLLSTSPSPGGGKTAIEHAAVILTELAGKIVGKFSVPDFYENTQVNENGFEIKNDFIRQQLYKHISDFENEITKNTIQV